MKYAILIPDKGLWNGEGYTADIQNALLFPSPETAMDYFVSGLNNVRMFYPEIAAAFIPCYVHIP